VPARLINIKYITIRAEKVASPVTALQCSTYLIIVASSYWHTPVCTYVHTQSTVGYSIDAIARAMPVCLLGVCSFLLDLFSERELTFTFAICYRPSVCLSSVCRLSSVTFVRPTQAIEIFRNISVALGTLAIH